MFGSVDFPGIPAEENEYIRSWLLFEGSRKRLPSKEVLISQLALRSTKINWNMKLDPAAYNLQQRFQSSLVVTEEMTEGWRTGSVWAIDDLGPTETRKERLSVKCAKMSCRLAALEIHGLANLFFTEKVSSTRIRFLIIREEDGGQRSNTYGVFDRDTGKILSITKTWMYMDCPFCSARAVACACPSMLTGSYFETQRLSRWQKCRLSARHTGASRVEYMNLWMSGRWSMRVDNEAFHCVTLNFSTPGNIVQRLLSGVLQLDSSTVVELPLKNFTDHGLQKLYSTFLSEREEEEEAVEKSSKSTVRNSVSTYKCSTCDNTFKHKSYLQRHIRSVHEKASGHLNSRNSAACPNRSHIDDNLRIAQAPKSQTVCNICGKDFGVPSKLNRHILTVHLDMRQFPCWQCSKTFKDKNGLNKHLQRKHLAGT